MYLNKVLSGACNGSVEVFLLITDKSTKDLVDSEDIHIQDNSEFSVTTNFPCVPNKVTLDLDRIKK